MLCGMAIADVEAKLGAALTASLRAPAAERTAFIAQFLQSEGKAPLPVVQNSQPPVDLDAEIATLAQVIRMAVNSASRRSGDPIQNIAMFLLRQCGEDEQETPASESGPESSAEQQQSSSSPSAAADSAAGAKPRNLTGLRSALGVDGRVSPVARRPVLGNDASQVLPAVIGAFQEEAARKAAKQVDESLIAAAMTAGAANAEEDAKQKKAEAAEAAKRAKELERANFGMPTSSGA